MTDLARHSIVDLAAMLHSGQLSAAELTKACLSAIETREDELRAWAHIDPDLALAQAARLDRLPAARRGPLHGVPVGVKDIIDTTDLPTEYGSTIYAGHQPDTDAVVVTRLRNAGAVVLGKTVTTEFALFTPGPTTNPHDATRTPGGSSSGSAAAVGAGTIPLTIGTQTAGSTIRPASFCGIIGVKPTYGAIPTTGVKASSPSLDTIGVFTRDVAGATYALSALTGTTLPHHQSGTPPESLRIGFAPSPQWEQIPASTRARIEQVVQRLSAALNVAEIQLPSPFAELVDAHTCVMNTEVTHALEAERRHHTDQLSVALREQLAIGDRTSSMYETSREHITRCRAPVPDLFQAVDVLLTPSVLDEAPPLEHGTGDPILCRTWTALGTPAVSVPVLTGPSGLPLGMQVVARPDQDHLALAAAHHVLRTLTDEDL